MSLSRWRIRTSRRRRGLHGCVLVCTVLTTTLHTSGQARPLSVPRPPATERLALSPIDQPPYSRTLLTDNANETGFFVQEWADRFGRRTLPAPLISAQIADGHRPDSPFLAFNKRSRRWSSAAISRHAHAVYPVQRDPYNDALIRHNATFVPHPIESKGFDDEWVVSALTDSGSTVSLVVLESGEWFNRHEFDKATRRWRPTRYGWVSSQEVPLFERPDDRSPQIDRLRPGMHFGKQGHDHFGHAIVVLDDMAEWQRVITCRNVVGWIMRVPQILTAPFPEILAALS